MSDSSQLEISVGPNNSDWRFIIDYPRRICDMTGNFEAKRGQTNEQFEKTGRIVLRLPNAKIAERVKNLIEEYCHSSIRVRSI